ncbi:MAG: hypothetical protein JXR19_03695 [Bacteroidia bacterium]
MRRFMFLVSYLIVIASLAQSVLSPGDLAIVQYNSDNPDQISFVCLSPIDSGTTINFTDKGWLSSQSFRSGEGIFSWNSTRSYACGDVVTLDSISPIALSSTGDQILVFQDSATAPRFITAFNNEGAGVWQTTASSANTSALPAGLTNGLNAIALIESDNAVYDSIISGAKSVISSLVFDRATFKTSNTSRQNWSGSFSLSTGCVLPVEWLNVHISYDYVNPILVWETASELNSDYFQIEYSTNGFDFTTIGNVPANGNSAEIIRYEYPLALDQLGYIRIKQVDYDQASSYSKAVFLKKPMVIGISCTGDNYTISANGEFELEVYSSLGKRIFHKKGQGGLIVDGYELERGWLFFRIKSPYDYRSYKLYRSY